MVGVDTLVDLCQLAADGDAVALQLAEELDKALTELSKFDEGPDLVLYYKQLMVLEGDPEYAHHINKTDALSSTQQAFLESEWQRFRECWNDWKGAL